ncbi:glutamic acid-rich protein-like [Cimex lectularius]|uniref:Uncharacterized protein n=1 Tax=Cimex lectularius TaxID=79782 RepID=A0A8I6THX5_CIMLE|nr:glutamic acid-rich protein-like [Cimex lectularius]
MQSENLELPFDADCPNCVKEWIGDCNFHFIKNYEATYAEKSEQPEPAEDILSQSIYNEWVSLGKSFWLNEETQGNVLLSSLNLELVGIKEQTVEVNTEETVKKCTQQPKRKPTIIAIRKTKSKKLKRATVKETVRLKLSFLKSILKKKPKVRSSKPSRQVNPGVSKPGKNKTTKKAGPSKKNNKSRKTKVNKCNASKKQELSQKSTLSNQANSENKDLNKEPKGRLCLQDIKNTKAPEAWENKNNDGKKRERKQVLKELEAQESFVKVVLNRQKKSSHKKRHNAENKENCFANISKFMFRGTENDERRPLILRRNCNKKQIL